MAPAKQNYITETMKRRLRITDISEGSYVYEESGQALTTLEGLFNNASYSDITLRLGANGIQIPAHRIILAMYSPVLNDVLSKKPEGYFEFLCNDCSAHSYWRVFHYIYNGIYHVEAAEVLGSTDDEPGLLVHATVALLARELFHMPELEEYALQRLKSQLHGWSVSELFEGIQEMYAIQYQAARQEFITEAIRSYLQVPQLAQALRKAALEIKEFAVDLVEALGNMHGELEN